MDVLIFTAGLVTMFAAHQVSDHVFGQTDHDADNKTLPGNDGWTALLSHVVKYHIIMVLMLSITFITLDWMTATTTGLALAMAFSFITHMFLDRRWPVEWILNHTGSPQFAKLTHPLNGMYLADQGLHYFFLWISALLLTVG